MEDSGFGAGGLNVDLSDGDIGMPLSLFEEL